jgi:hypothetical protein
MPIRDICSWYPPTSSLKIVKYISYRLTTKGKQVVDKNGGNTMHSHIDALGVIALQRSIWFIVGDGQVVFDSDDTRVQTFCHEERRQRKGGKGKGQKGKQEKRKKCRRWESDPGLADWINDDHSL